MLRVIFVIDVFIFVLGGTLGFSGAMEKNMLSDDWAGNYFYSLLLNFVQTVEFFGYGVVTICIQNSVVVSKRNFGWYVLMTNFFCFITEYLKDVIVFKRMGFKYAECSEFLGVEVLRVPFKLAAVELIFAAAYWFTCLKKAKSILKSAEPHALDTFEVEESQTM